MKLIQASRFNRHSVDRKASYIKIYNALLYNSARYNFRNLLTAFGSILLFIMTSVTFNPVAYASVNGDLNQVFNDLGYSSNTTSPSVYQGQETGYYNSGGIQKRKAVQQSQLASLDLPSFQYSGDGSLDAYPNHPALHKRLTKKAHLKKGEKSCD